MVRAIASSMLLTGCLDEIPDNTSDQNSADNHDDIMSALPGYRAFPKVNKAPFPSDLGSFKVNLFVDLAAASYQKIDPAKTGSRVEMPVGTLIVREVLDDYDGVTKLTLMYKGAPGSDPTLGDWWFGVTDPSGVPLVENGIPQLGPLPACHSCHIPRAADDYLFGVASQDQ